MDHDDGYYVLTIIDYFHYRVYENKVFGYQDYSSETIINPFHQLSPERFPSIRIRQQQIKLANQYELLFTANFFLRRRFRNQKGFPESKGL